MPAFPDSVEKIAADIKRLSVGDQLRLAAGLLDRGAHLPLVASILDEVRLAIDRELMRRGRPPA